VRQDTSDGDDSSQSSSSSSSSGNDDDSSSDDNDSHAAAHAAAIGHSPESMVRHPPPTSLSVGATAAAAAGLSADGESTVTGKEGPSRDATTDGSEDSTNVVNNGKTTCTKEPSEDARQTKSKEEANEKVRNDEAKVADQNEGSSTHVDGRQAAPKSEAGTSPVKEDDAVSHGNEDAHKDPSQTRTSDDTDKPLSGEPLTSPSAIGNAREAHDRQETAAMEISPEDTLVSQPSRDEGEKAPAEAAMPNKDAKINVPDAREQHDQGVKEADDKPREKQKQKKKKVPKEPTFYCPYDLNERDDDENTPIHIAIHACKLEHVRLLLKAGASVHRKCDGSAPVHLAISLGGISHHVDFARDCVNVLCEYGADLSVRDDAMHTPLYLACVAALPSIASVILADVAGVQTLNAKADRVGGRALHAAARFDLPPRSAGAPRHRPRSSSGHHHHRGHAISGMHDHHSPHRAQPATQSQHEQPGSGDTREPQGDVVGAAALTQLLLATPGIEIDPPNNYGRTPLHIAAMYGNWQVARLLLQHGSNAHMLDRRGYTPGHLAQKRGIVIPNDLLSVLGPSAGHVSSVHSPSRDLIMDPDSKTILLCHELCSRHMSCPPITREEGFSDPPPENIRRLRVLLNEEVGILRCGEFLGCSWETEARRASMADVLKVHEYSYVEHISQLCSSLPDHPKAIASLDADTAVSRWSFEAAMRAAGGLCEAVDKVMSGDFRNAFCAVRPPGHHAGPRGIVTCANDPDGSHGFCLLNNVAIGAAYARSMYRNEGIRRVAIIDFDVHHGNGTEEIVRQLVPNVERAAIRTPFASGMIQTPTYRPWLDENDIHDVFFASTHGYGPRDLRFADHLNPAQGGWFYPASGKTRTTDAILSPSNIEHPNLTDFLHSQTWTRMGEDNRSNCCKIINIGLDLPRPHDVPGMQRVELRDSYRKNILPHLLDFDPDMIFISAGFDAHKKDTMNFGYVGMVEDDYEWVTEQLVKVANSCCNGRIISVLEGGYKIHGGIISPFARSVASHVRALVDGGSSRELYDKQDGEWESQFERHMVEDKERRRQMKMERLRPPHTDTEARRYHHARQAHHLPPSVETRGQRARSDSHAEMDDLMNESLDIQQHQYPHHNAHVGTKENQSDEEDEPSRKRRRNHVDYKELYEQMKKEGFSG